MKTYLKIHFSSEGFSPMEVIKLVKSIGFAPVVGNYDFSIEFSGPKEYAEIVDKLHDKLKGTKVMYALSTKER